MKDYTKYRNSYRLGSEICTFFKHYKKIIILLLFLALLGIVAGIFTSTKYSSSLELENIPDKNLVDFITNGKGSFGTFFAYAIKYLIVIFLIIFLNINTFFSIVNIIYIFIFGYQIGFTVYAIIAIYSFAGIINSVIIIIPFQLLLLGILIFISALSINKNKIICKYGKLPFCNNYKQLYIILSILFFGVLFVWCMILPVIKITIIVN